MGSVRERNASGNDWTISDIEKVFDACEEHSLEFADNLDWEDGDTEDEEYLLAKDVNEILGKRYYRV